VCVLRKGVCPLFSIYVYSPKTDERCPYVQRCSFSGRAGPGGAWSWKGGVGCQAVRGYCFVVYRYSFTLAVLVSCLPQKLTSAAHMCNAVHSAAGTVLPVRGHGRVALGARRCVGIVLWCIDTLSRWRCFGTLKDLLDQFVRTGTFSSRPDLMGKNVCPLFVSTFLVWHLLP